MRILFDHSTPRGLAAFLPSHEVATAYLRGWAFLKNGELLAAAETAGFDLLLTADQQIRYQQNLTDRRIALVVLTGTNRWSRIRLCADRIALAVDTARPGSYAEVQIPF